MVSRARFGVRYVALCACAAAQSTEMTSSYSLSTNLVRTACIEGVLVVQRLDPRASRFSSPYRTIRVRIELPHHEDAAYPG